MFAFLNTNDKMILAFIALLWVATVLVYILYNASFVVSWNGDLYVFRGVGNR